MMQMIPNNENILNLAYYYAKTFPAINGTKALQ